MPASDPTYKLQALDWCIAPILVNIQNKPHRPFLAEKWINILKWAVGFHKSKTNVLSKGQDNMEEMETQLCTRLEDLTQWACKFKMKWEIKSIINVIS